MSRFALDESYDVFTDGPCRSTNIADQDLQLDEFDRELLAEAAVGRQQTPYNCHGSRLTSPPSIGLRQQSQTPGLIKGNLYSSTASPASSSITTAPLTSSPTLLHSRKQPTGRRRDPRLDPIDSSSQGHLQINSERRRYDGAFRSMQPMQLSHAPPIIQGIQLIETSRLPDHLRSIFKFPLFNAVQSKCFSHVYDGNENLVLSAPTGSGKTAVMELAICRLLVNRTDEEFKVVYQAPTKSLCNERYRDWTSKFSTLGLKCAELTGDVELGRMRDVQQADVIIATPEKWDSITRKWKDNARLMRMIRLFLVDEVHILKESRGATLEAVVSRMKSVGSTVRFVALSATVPNSEDVATWLGLNSTKDHLPAIREVFGEEFRPTELEKHVLGFKSPPNDFILDSILVKEVPAVIARYSRRKPIMIFCPTQKSATKTAHELANLWQASSAASQLWDKPSNCITVADITLKNLVTSGVAFHHGGLVAADRRAVENGFLTGNISIICSTSTLAVGVNLPCYLVILKGTSCYTETGLQEYSAIEITQMLGRAGRPQFETSACAVIMTSKDKVPRYEKLLTGHDLLESSLHENLIEHLNAEIDIGTVYDLPSAKKWLSSTFLHVRVQRNPTYYKFDKSSGHQNDTDILQSICVKDLQLLEEAKIVEKIADYRCTEAGQAMSRYYVKYDTMRNLLSIPPKAKISEILVALSQAKEFQDLRWKPGERAFYKKINKSNEIRFPIAVDISSPAHKVSLLIQAALGGYTADKDGGVKYLLQMQQDTKTVLSNCNRLIRCIIDVQLGHEDSISTKNALELARSIAAKVWDHTPMQLKQLEGIGDVTARKLAVHGIKTVDALLTTEPHEIQLILGKNPPFGSNIRNRAAQFPSLCVTVKELAQRRSRTGTVEIQVQSEIGFLNDKTPAYFNRKAVYVCFLCETSDGHLVDFRRFAATRLAAAQPISLKVQLSRPTKHIRCHVMCDEVAGTHRYAEIELNIAKSWFPKAHLPTVGKISDHVGELTKSVLDAQSFEDLEIDDIDLLNAETDAVTQATEVMDIDDILQHGHDQGHEKMKKMPQGIKRKADHIESTEDENDESSYWRKPQRLPNGRWTCQHVCVDQKRECKHACCNEGVRKPRKRPKDQNVNDSCQQYNMVTDGTSVVREPSSMMQDNASVGHSHQTETGLKGEHTSASIKKIDTVSSPSMPYSNNYTLETALDQDNFSDLFSDDLPSIEEILTNRTLTEKASSVPNVREGTNSTQEECDGGFGCPGSTNVGESLEYDTSRTCGESQPISAGNAFAARSLVTDLTKRKPDLDMSRIQTRSGAEVLDINMDEFFNDEHGDVVVQFEEREKENNTASKSLDEENDPRSIEANSDIPRIESSPVKPGAIFWKGVSNDTIEERRKKEQHEKDQAAKWAKFDPWLREQFGDLVDII